MLTRRAQCVQRRPRISDTTVTETACSTPSCDMRDFLDRNDAVALVSAAARAAS